MTEKRDERFYRDFEYFFRRVLEVREEREDSIPTGLVAASAGLLAVPLGILPAIIGGAMAALGIGSSKGRMLVRRLRAEADDDEFEEYKERIKTARRIFTELSAELEEHPELTRQEIEELFEELVEDRPLTG